MTICGRVRNLGKKCDLEENRSEIQIEHLNMKKEDYVFSRWYKCGCRCGTFSVCSDVLFYVILFSYFLSLLYEFVIFLQDCLSSSMGIQCIILSGYCWAFYGNIDVLYITLKKLISLLFKHFNIKRTQPQRPHGLHVQRVGRHCERAD